MSDKLVFTEDVANEALRAVRLTNARLASAQANADTYAEAAGHRELSRAIRGSASSWRINRDRLSERLTSVGDAVDGVVTTLKAIDDAFAAGMAAASQPSSDAVSSSPPASGGSGSVGGGSPQRIDQPDALATPGASAGALGGGATTAPVAGPVPEAPAGAAPEGSPPAGSDVSLPEATDPGNAPWGPGALLPTMPSGSEQQQLRAVLGEFAAKWESVTGTPPEGVIALLGLLGAAGAGAAAASGSRASAPPAAGGHSTPEGPGGELVASVPSPGSSDATTGQVGSSIPGTPGEPGTDNQPGALGGAGNDAALVDADEVPAGVGGADAVPASAESGVEGNVTPPRAEVPETVPERVPELAESVGTSGSDDAPPMADLPELEASSTPNVLPDLPPLDAVAQPGAASAAPGASAPDLPSLDAAAHPTGSPSVAATSLPSLEARPGHPSDLLPAPREPLASLEEGAQPRTVGAMPMGPMSTVMPKPVPAVGAGLGMSGSGTPVGPTSSSPGPTTSSPGPRDAQVLVADEPSGVGLDPGDEPEKGSTPGE